MENKISNDADNKNVEQQEIVISEEMKQFYEELRMEQQEQM